MPAEAIKTYGKRAPDGAWEVPVLGDIGFFGIDGADLIRELNAVKPSTVKFLIYSPGGAVYDAIAVAGYIQDKGIECYAEIFGTCMSAATVFAALAGPKRTAIAAGSMFLVHMPYGGDQKAIDNAADYLIDLYVKSYGWTKAEARKHMEADEGNGILWTADEAKELGVVSEVMKMSLAAHYKQKHTAMAEKKKTTVTVNLNLGERVSAAFGGQVTAEIDVDQAVADQLAEKDTRIAQLETELAEAKKAPEAEEVQEEVKEEVKEEAPAEPAEVVAMRTDLAKANARVAELEAAMKKPLAKATVGDNRAAGVGAAPGAPEKDNPNTAVLKQAMAKASKAEKVAVKPENATA